VDLHKRIKRAYEDLSIRIPYLNDKDELDRAARQYYTDVGDSRPNPTGIMSHEIYRGSKNSTDDHIRAPQSMFKLRWKYDRDSFTDFEQFSNNFLLDRYTVKVTKPQNVKVKHPEGGIIPTSFAYDNITSFWWEKSKCTKEFPRMDIFPIWYLEKLNMK